MSLPAAFACTTPATIPNENPYLSRHDPPAGPHAGSIELEVDVPGFKIGIVWQTNSTTKGYYLKSCPLKHFEPLARIEKVRLWVSLQVWGRN